MTLPPFPVGNWPDFPAGHVWLVGAGPGDAGLLTLHGLNALSQADVIVYDALVDTGLLAWAKPGAAIEYAGKRGGKPSPKQRDISLRLVALARAGQRVLRLKGGDPFVFGRGGEEAQSLVAAGVPIRVIPGITAGIGGLAHVGIPATHRDVNQAVTFVTGHDAQGLAPATVNWPAVAAGSPVIVIYMAMKHLAQITDQLLAAGRSPEEPVAIVAEATLPGERVLETTLGRVAVEGAAISPPAVVVVGEVVRLRQVLDWAGQLRGDPVRDLDPLGLRGQRDVG